MSDSDNNDNSEDSIEIYGTCGLQNIGNTCYLNSILQCFSNIPTFKDAILNDKNIIKIILKNEYNYNVAKDYSLSFITVQLKRILTNLWQNSNCDFKAKSFTKLFKNKNKFFQNTEHQDSQEALLSIINSIANELEEDFTYEVKNKSITYDCLDNLFSNEERNIDEILNLSKYDYKTFIEYIYFKFFTKSYKKYSVIEDLFTGQYISQLLCSETKGKKVSFESFRCMELSIPEDTSESSDNSQSINDTSEKTSSVSKSTSDDKTMSDETVSDSSANVKDNKINNDNDDNSNDDDNHDSSNDNDDSSNGDDNHDSNNDDDEDYDDEILKYLDPNYKVSNKSDEQESYTLYNLLDNLVKPEILTDDNKWNSPYAKKLVDATKQITIFNTPKILIFAIKRFDNFLNKLNNLIRFPINLDMSPYIHSQNIANYTKYRLVAINNHTNFNNFGFNNGLTFGHYTSFVRNNIDKEWYKIDDDSVYKVRKKDIVSDKAYILFYEAYEPDEDVDEEFEDTTDDTSNQDTSDDISNQDTCENITDDEEEKKNEDENDEDKQKEEDDDDDINSMFGADMMVHGKDHQGNDFCSNYKNSAGIYDY